MSSPCVDLSWKPFSHAQEVPGSSRHAQGNSSSFGSSTGLCEASSSDLTRYSAGVFKAAGAFVAIISKGPFRDILKSAFPAEYSYGNRRGNRTTSNSHYRSCVTSSGCIFLIILLQFLYNKQRVIFLLVCLLLRSTIIGKTSRFLMGYFSSVFLLYFVYSPNTVTSQLMKVFASDG